MRTITFVFVSILLLFSSCATDESSNGKVLTKKIQYDVNIKSPDPELDWWIQNIEGEKREGFIRTLLEKAYAGEVNTWDFFNRPLTARQVWEIGNRRDTLTFQRAEPPFGLFDTVVEQNFDIQDVTRIRFLEEWTYEENSMNISKRIIGICPVLRRYNIDGSFRGYMPMFWVYFDENYPGDNALKHPASTN